MSAARPVPAARRRRLQVASVLYYCTLKSDLEVIARQEHQYVPDYIPWGMDATIYWGSH